MGLFLRGLEGLAISYELDAVEQTRAAHVADQPMSIPQALRRQA